MKKMIYKHDTISGELAELIDNNGITMICDENMNILISDEDWDKLCELAPAAIDDFCELTYDVVFNDENDSNCKGFKSSLEYCKKYIELNNGSNDSYFADYKGGVVSVVCNETGEEVYSEEVK